MKLRVKIIVAFAVTFLSVLGIALGGIYYLMALNRKQEFTQRIKDKTTTTYRLLLDVQGIDHDILHTFDKNTINNLYDEKVLLFDSLGHVIYSSVDDTKILFPQEIVNQLKGGKDEVIYTEGEYEVYAHVIIDKGKTFFAMGKALDKYGKGKLRFLGIALIAIYAVSLFIVILTSYLIAKSITAPILTLTNEVNNRSINNLAKINIAESRDEIDSLAEGFNNMLSRVEEAYRYQKNFIHHISHELKTPIAVLISNLERVQATDNVSQWKNSLDFQKTGLMQLATVINTLLDISKYETNPELSLNEVVRLDELVFGCFENLKHVYPEAKLNLSIGESFQNAEEISCHGVERMLSIAFFNLIKNAIEYSENREVSIKFENEPQSVLIVIANNGPTLSSEEQPMLFQHFFRGQNTKEKSGIGLGLVMAHKIIQLHGGQLTYSVSADGQNSFCVRIAS